MADNHVMPQYGTCDALQVFQDSMLAGIAFKRIDVIRVNVMATLECCLMGEKQLIHAIVNAINLAIAFDDGLAIEVLVGRLLHVQCHHTTYVSNALVHSITIAVKFRAFQAVNAIGKTLAQVACVWPSE